MNVTLREMNESEFKTYSKFSFENFLQETTKSSGKSALELRDLLGGPPNSRSESDLWMVISADDHDAGFLWVKIESEASKAIGYDIYLNPEFRSRGVGREVLTRYCVDLKNRGIDKVEMCVYKENKIARNLYASMGFSEVSFDAERNQIYLELTI